MKLQFFSVFYLAVFQLSLATAQTPDFSIIHYTTDHGLPQNSVKSISFDQAGFCWLATEMGLVRFDGHSFKVFNSFNIPGCRAERISLITSDTAGYLYARNELSQKFIIDVQNRFAAPVPRLLSKDSSLCVLEGYAINNAALYSSIKEKEGVDYVVYMPENGIYRIGSGKLSYAAKDGWLTAYHIENENGLQYLPAGATFLLFEKNKPAKAWNNGVQQPSFKGIEGPLQQNRSYKQGTFFCYNTQGQSYIYAGNILYGIYEQNGIIVSKVLLDNLDIPVLCAVYYSAHQRKYYIGSLVSGLYVVSLSDFTFPRQAKDAQGEGFYSQVMTEDGNIICQRYIYRNNNNPIKLPLNQYVGATLFLDRQKLYYGNDPELFCYELNTGKNYKMFDLDSRPSSIYCDKTDNDVTIISTSFSLGKMIQDSLQVIKKIPGTTEIMNTVQTGRDSFLIATKTGVKWYDFANNKVYRSVLDSLYIRSVYPEPDGKVWISTYNKGFYLYENGRVHTLPVQGYEALRTIHCFIDDGHGNFWLPTNDGLFTVKKEALMAYVRNRDVNVYYYLYSVYDNLRTNEFNGGCTPAYLWTADSMLSLPSIAGLVQFHPNRIKQLIPGKSIYIDEIRLRDSVITLSAMKDLVLKPDYGRLAVTVSTPYFGARENLKLVYKIKGQDTEWEPVPDNGRILLDGFAPGKYDFLVTSLTGNGSDQRDPLQFSINIAPWFYNTWWFYGLMALTVIIGVVILAMVRVNMLKARNAKLQAIIHTQTADLKKTVQQLTVSEQALTESNRTKDNVITMVLHDLRSPISFLDITSDQLVKNYDQMTLEQLRDSLTVLKSSTSSLHSFTEQFFAWAASQHQGFKVAYKTLPLQELFNELRELYADIATTNKNRLEFLPTDIIIKTDRNILSIVIRNLLDNANKNTSAGLISGKAAAGENEVIISVSDTGTGLSADAIQAYYNNNETTGLHGNGSVIVLNLLQKIGGRLEIQSSEKGGTIFQIIMNRQ